MTEQTNINAATTQDQNTASTPTQTGAANPGSTEAKLFTQAELEKHINARIEKAAERDARIKAELLSQLGLDPKSTDFDALKSTIEESRKRKLDEMNDAQKAQAELQTVAQQKAELEAKVTALLEARKSDLIEGAIRTEAAKLKANNAKTVLSYILVNHKDAMQASIDDDGVVDEKKITALLSKVKEEDATLFQTVLQGAGSPSNRDGRATGQIANTDAAKRAHQMNQKLIRG